MTLEEIKKNKAQAIRLKKATLKTRSIIDFKPVKASIITGKAYADDTHEVIYRDIVLNTYYWMDSHDDVHVKGTFNKSLQENKSRIVHLHDHIYSLSAKVGEFQEIAEKTMNWLDLGVNKAGQTIALVATSKIIKDYNKSIFNQYLSNSINQHSVGMRYLNIILAMNDANEAEEYKTWKEYIDQIANSERAFEKGFFWVVKEAMLIEGSAVIMGSNEVTPTLPKNILIEEINQKFGNVENLEHLCQLIALDKAAQAPQIKPQLNHNKFLF